MLSAKIIEDKILNNYTEYQYLFVEFQSKFLSSLYNRYQCIENGNIVLYFAKQTHQDILRQKDYDLNFDISYEKLWENYSGIKPRQRSLVKVADDILLPKETVRRKILQLIKQKVLYKGKKNIGWLPNEQYKKSYSLVIDQEINDVCKLITFICKKINFSIAREELKEEIKKNFSFYWFHYLEAQLKYLNLWSYQFNDREIILILLQVTHLFTSKAKEKGLSHSEIFYDQSILKEFISASISATSISEITKMPRATCVRKLEHLVDLKVVAQDKISKRYYIIPTAISENLISKKITKEVVKNFSEFFFICIRGMNPKT